MSDAGRPGTEAPGASTQNTVIHLELPPRQPLARIHILGSMRATTYVGENILARSRKGRALLGYLCLNGGERVARSRLCSLLWERVSDRQARSSLRQALFEVSSAMGPLVGELISADVDTVRLEPRACWIDALAVLSSEHAGELGSLCTGELLEDLSGITPPFDQWLLMERTRFASRLRVLFESEMERLGNAPAVRRAALARDVIAFDPTHEGASRVLMRALIDMGERAQAIREYERCREALKTTLDVEPMSETRALYDAVRTFQGNGAASRQSYAVPSCGRLRVGVMPLRAHGTVGQNIADSLGQEIAAALARFRWFDVIAPVALVPTVDGKLPSGLHYVVEGEMSGDDKRLRVNFRLLDVTDLARPVWSDRFELAADELDRIDELVTAPAVARIDPVILFIEGRQKRREHSGPVAIVLQAISLMYSMERDKYEEAGRLLIHAAQLDPDNAMVAAWGAYWQVFNVGQGWSSNPAEALATAQKLAIKAIRTDPDNAEALGIYAHICAFLDKDFETALHYFERSRRSNPNLPFIWALSAATHSYIGEPDIALQQLERYHHLAPSDPYLCFWENIYTVAYMFKGDYEKAVAVGRRVVMANPEYTNTYKPLIAALGHLGRREEAAPYVAKLLSLEPGFTAAKFGKDYPIRKPEDRARYLKGLVLAGVPEA
jgi:DNA-binding SARP family transcriptional activator